MPYAGGHWKGMAGRQRVYKDVTFLPLKTGQDCTAQKNILWEAKHKNNTMGNMPLCSVV